MTEPNVNVHAKVNAHLWAWEDDQSALDNDKREALSRLIFEGTAHLIGEAPPPRMHPGSPIWERHSPMFPYPPQSAGGRMLKISDYGLGMYIHGLQRQNLMPVYAEKWNPRHASARAAEFMRRFRPAYVIMCGRKVSTAFGYEGTVPARYESKIWQGVTMYAIPHPSGRNPQSSDKGNQEIVRGYFAEVREAVAWKWARFKDLRETISA